MEVHHHPHAEKKNFKEYLLEGLMIFLAVTLGFIAENIREHIVNKERESQYMKSFVRDLSKDETQLPELVKNIQVQQLEAADSLPILLKYINLQKPANKIYLYMRGITRQQPLSAYITDRTIVQLKNAGEIRLISNQQIVDSLIEYYKHIDFVTSLQGILEGDAAGTNIQTNQMFADGKKKCCDKRASNHVTPANLYPRHQFVNHCKDSTGQTKTQHNVNPVRKYRPTRQQGTPPSSQCTQASAKNE